MNNSDLFHYWAHQRKDYANGSNCSYSGRICYSYSQPIGMLLENGEKTLAVLSDERFSVTTSKHQSIAWRAVHNLYPVISVDYNFKYLINWELDEIVNLIEKIYIDSIFDNLIELSNKRKKAVKIVHSIGRTFEELKKLYRFISKSFDEFSSTVASKINESNRFDFTFNNLDVWFQYACDEIYNAPRKQFIQKSQDEIIELWRNGKRQGLGNLRLNKTLLRYRPKVDRIETSKGISFSIEQAKSFWQDIQDVVESSVEKSVNYLGFNGHINSDGSLKIGCHEIEYSEILNLAKQLQLC